MCQTEPPPRLALCIEARTRSMDAVEEGHERAGYGVWLASSFLVADSVGAGVLALPGQARVAGLGWFAGFFALNVVANLYAGRLLLAVDGGYTTLTRNSVGNIVELADLVIPEASWCVRIVWYANLVLTLGQYVVVMTNGLLLAGLSSSRLVLSIAAASCALGLSQLSTLVAIGRRGLVHGSLSATFVILTLCIAFGGPAPQRKRASGFTRALEMSAALSSINFAFGSQRLLLNVRREMREPSRAHHALSIALPTFAAIYAAVVLLAGPRPPDFLLDRLARFRQFAGYLLFGHIAVSYTLNMQAFAVSLTQKFSSSSWLATTVLLTVSCWLVANLVPHFSDLANLTGALTSAPINIGIPALLYMCRRRCTPSTSDAERTRHRRFSVLLGPFLLVVLASGIVVAGTSGAVFDIVRGWRSRSA